MSASLHKTVRIKITGEIVQVFPMSEETYGVVNQNMRVVKPEDFEDIEVKDYADMNELSYHESSVN